MNGHDEQGHDGRQEQAPERPVAGGLRLEEEVLATEESTTLDRPLDEVREQDPDNPANAQQRDRQIGLGLLVVPKVTASNHPASWRF